MPIAFNDSQGLFELPTGWHEVLTRQYLDLDRLQLATVEARASYFAGRTIQVNALVADALAFLLSEPSIGQVGSTYPVDLGQETYLQVETIRAALSKPLHECYGEVYGTFTARMRNYHVPEFNQATADRLARDCMAEHVRGTFAFELWAVTQTYPAVRHCLSELQRLSTKYAELSEPDPTEAGRKARQAGASSLDAFGHFNTALHYARQFGVTVDEVYGWPWETVALLLLHDRRVAIVHDNLNKQAEA